MLQGFDFDVRVEACGDFEADPQVQQRGGLDGLNPRNRVFDRAGIFAPVVDRHECDERLGVLAESIRFQIAERAKLRGAFERIQQPNSGGFGNQPLDCLFIFRSGSPGCAHCADGCDPRERVRIGHSQGIHTFRHRRFAQWRVFEIIGVENRAQRVRGGLAHGGRCVGEMARHSTRDIGVLCGEERAARERVEQRDGTGAVRFFQAIGQQRDARGAVTLGIHGEQHAHGIEQRVIRSAQRRH